MLTQPSSPSTNELHGSCMSNNRRLISIQSYQNFPSKKYDVVNILAIVNLGFTQRVGN